MIFQQPLFTAVGQHPTIGQESLVKINFGSSAWSNTTPLPLLNSLKNWSRTQAIFLQLAFAPRLIDKIETS